MRTREKSGAGACTLVLVGVILWTGLAHAWTSAQPGYVWSFPRDHWARDGYKTEWWYFTGHLRTAGEPSPRFGFQFTFFRVGVSRDAPAGGSAWAASNIIMGHAALTDLETGGHRFSELVVRAAPLLGGFGRHPDPRIAWSVGPPGTPDEWQLRWKGEGFDFNMDDAGKSFGFELSTRPLKPVVYQGPGGVSRKGEGATEASHYYSFTRMATSGTVRLDGKEWEVSGTSWMDKEFGSNQLGKDTEGWDWFSLQLDDGREVMLYLLRNRDGGTRYAGATLVETGGAVRYLQPGEWKLNATGQWTSPASGAPLSGRLDSRHPGRRHPRHHHSQSGRSGEPERAHPEPVLLGGFGPGRIRERRADGAGVCGADGLRREQPPADMKSRPAPSGCNLDSSP